MELASCLPLVGIPVVVAGFALRFNPLLVVTAAGLATGLAVGMDIGVLLETFGEKFLNSRQLATFILILPVIGLLERYGERARAAVDRRHTQRHHRPRPDAVFRGEGDDGGAWPDQSGRSCANGAPLLAPMAEGAAANRLGELPEALRDRIRAHAAACDNVAVFFGEDIFIAFGAVLLMDAFLRKTALPMWNRCISGYGRFPPRCAPCSSTCRGWRGDASLQREVAAWRARREASA